jgi:hypothetical protein
MSINSVSTEQNNEIKNIINQTAETLQSPAAGEFKAVSAGRKFIRIVGSLTGASDFINAVNDCRQQKYKGAAYKIIAGAIKVAIIATIVNGVLPTKEMGRVGEECIDRPTPGGETIKSCEQIFGDVTREGWIVKAIKNPKEFAESTKNFFMNLSLPTYRS